MEAQGGASLFFLTAELFSQKPGSRCTVAGQTSRPVMGEGRSCTGRLKKKVATAWSGQLNPVDALRALTKTISNVMPKRSLMGNNPKSAPSHASSVSLEMRENKMS